MRIELHGIPKSEVILKTGKEYVHISYDRKGFLRLIRKAKEGKLNTNKPKHDETVFRVINFEEGKASFKSSGSHCGFLSVNGCVYWSTIWDDGDDIFKMCSFQNWVNECAEVLAGEKKSISKN
jgi:hypothetical protein